MPALDEGVPGVGEGLADQEDGDDGCDGPDDRGYHEGFAPFDQAGVDSEEAVDEC